MVKFKLIRTYHKEYKIFSDPYVLNVGNIWSAARKKQDVDWLLINMNFCPILEPTVFNSMNAEWSIWNYVSRFYNIDNDTFLSFQHYSKVLDLTSIRDTPYNDIPDTENNLGEKYRAATSLDEFGYGDIDKYLDSYPVIVGNQYPCMVYQSIKSKLKIPVEEVLKQFRNILINFNNSLFSVHMFDKYCNSNYQYWRGGPLIAKNSVFKKLLSFTIDFEHAFLDNKSYSDSSIYVLKDRRGNGYIGEIIMGFAIYCYIEDCKKQGKKIGYCRLLTDSNVVYSSTGQ